MDNEDFVSYVGATPISGVELVRVLGGWCVVLGFVEEDNILD